MDTKKYAAVSLPEGAQGYVQTVPDHCDRIVWRNRYYHLPLYAAPQAGGVLSDEAEFQLEGDEGVFLAGATGKREEAWREIQHYAAQYADEGPLTIYEVTRTPVTAPQPLGSDHPVSRPGQVAGDGALGLTGDKPAHTDHPLRHYDRTCPACNEDPQTAPPRWMPSEIAAIIGRLHTQDNRITSDPLFAVRQKRVIGGMADDYTDQFSWVCDGSEVDREEAARLDALRAAGEPIPDDCHRVGYIEKWEFVTACLTEQGCKDFIACYGHNLREPQIYAYSGYRNAEYIGLRKWLMSLRAEALPPGELAGSAGSNEKNSVPAPLLVAQPVQAQEDAKDAARYRWLTAHAFIGKCFTDGGVILEVQNTDRRVPIAGSVDAAIDAALRDGTSQHSQEDGSKPAAGVNPVDGGKAK